MKQDATYVEYRLNGSIRRTYFGEESGETPEDAATRYRETDGVDLVRIVRLSDVDHVSKSNERDYRVRLIELGRDINAYVEHVEAVNTQLRELVKTSTNRVTREALVRRKNELEKDLRELRSQHREVRQLAQSEHRAMLRGGAVSVADQIRAVASSAGCLEHLYLTLLEHIDVEGFDWQRYVRSAQKTLNGEREKV